MLQKLPVPLEEVVRRNGFRFPLIDESSIDVEEDYHGRQDVGLRSANPS
jgi:hypothetical protein